MAIVMGAVMAIIMLGFMWGMYPNRRANLGIVAGAVIVFTGALWLVRSQDTVGDVAYMKAMIPHHSIAIMTSERAHIKDPEVRKLADGIIDAQVREITQMKRMIARLEANPTPRTRRTCLYRDRQVPPPPPRRIRAPASTPCSRSDRLPLVEGWRAGARTFSHGRG
jgi:hypothetical protein